MRYRRRRLPSCRAATARASTADAEKHEAADHREEPGEVVAGRPAAERVVDGLGAGEDAEEAEEERERRPDARSNAAVDDRSAYEERKRYEAADEVVAGEVPGCGWRKLSSTTWSATRPTATRKTTGTRCGRLPFVESARHRHGAVDTTRSAQSRDG